MSKSPHDLISVIVPCYNYGRFIGDAIRSVQQQSYRNWECIIVDDGSNDDTAEQVRPFLDDPRVHYIFQQNAGISAARNAGINRSAGHYIQFLDADDKLSPDKFLEHMNFFQQFPTVEISYSNFHYFASDRPDDYFPNLELDRNWHLSKVSGRGSDLLKQLISGNTMPINAVLLRRAVIDRAGLFDLTLGWLEDWDFWLRCGFAGAEIRFMETSPAFALIRAHSTSVSKNQKKMQYSQLALRKKITNYLAEMKGDSTHRRVFHRMNRKYTIRVVARLIRSCGFRGNQMLELARSEGWSIFLRAFFRALKTMGKSSSLY